MRCLRCHAENLAGMKFCGQCGAALQAVCPLCGAANPPENRFCGGCGAPFDSPGLHDSATTEAYTPRPVPAGVPRAIRPGEMKQVTLLFCDIVNSTPLTERLGPEAMRDLVAAFLDTSLIEVHRYGGTAPQFTGDGFLALFGAPLTYEDHVRRALLAAVAIRSALGGGGPAADSGRLNLPVRIGIHTGPVVFGPIGESLPMDSTVIGDAANIAARLQQLAEPGEILLSETTRRLAQGFARLEAVGPLTLRGKDEPVAAYRLLGVSHRRTGLRESGSGHLTTFVDRYSELAILNSFLRQVENGRSQTIGIVGEPGIGKSRLLAEFHQQLVRGRVTWVEGRCVSYGTAIPYWLLLDLLRSNCGIIETDTPEAITKKIRSGLLEVGMDPEQDSPLLLHLLGISDIGGSLALSNPEAVKTKTFEIFHRLSIKGSIQRPLVLVLEDLHWVDKISEEFVGFLAENAADARILLLATYRPGYRPPWIDKSYAGQTPLQPLSRDDSRQMVRSVLSGERLVDLVAEEIVTKADGNPFFLEQLALHAGEAKDLRSDLMVPDSIHDVVMARIDRLPVEMKQLLQTAAVIGREFSFRLLSAVWKGAGVLETQLRELTRLEFISERFAKEGSSYVFRHALTQEAAYGSLLERQRRTRHGTVGRALEELFSGRTDEVAELLALHFGRSDEAEKAVDFAILAAEKSQRRWANSEALAYFTEALRRIDAMPDTEANRLRRIDAVLKQAEVQYLLGQYADNIKALDAIAAVVEQIGDPRHRATWHYWNGLLHGVTGGRLDVAIDHCREAAAIASTSDLEDIGALAESCLAQVYVVAGRLSDAVAAGERALSAFEARGNSWWAARTLWFLSIAANALGNWRVSLEYCRRGFEHGIALKELRNKSVEAIGWFRMGSAYIQQGDLERGLQCCNQALAVAAIPRDAAITKGIRGYGEIKAGRIELGIAELSDAVAWLRVSDLRYTYLHQALWLAEGYLRRGDRPTALSLVQDILERSRKAGYLHFEGRACWLMGECLGAEASASAEDYVETAIRIFEGVGARNDLARALLTCAALRQRAGDFPAARQLLDQAHTLFESIGTLDEPHHVTAALNALDRGALIRVLAERS